MFVNSAKINTSKARDIFKESIKREAEKLLNARARLYPIAGNPFTHANDVLNLVCQQLDLEVEQIKSNSRLRHIVEARQIYFYITTKLSVVYITCSLSGQLVNRDHSSVVYGAKVVGDLYESDIQFAQKYNKCINAYTQMFNNYDNCIMDFNNIPQF